MNAPTMARVFRKETYLRLSAALNSVKPAASETVDCKYQWERDCGAIADMLADQSEAFDKQQFLTNCGVIPAFKS